MDLVIKDLPEVVERKIKALHILSEGKFNLNLIFSRAILESINTELAKHIMEDYAPPTREPTPLKEVFPDVPLRGVPEVPDLAAQMAEQQRQQVELEKQARATHLQPHAPKVAPLLKKPEPTVAMFAEGLGDETDEYAADADLSAEPTDDGPEPPADPDDELVNGPADPEFDELTQVPEDLEDDDSLYADAASSYAPQQKRKPEAIKPTGPKAEDVGLPDLGSDEASMGFFDAQMSGGQLPAYARADAATRRRSNVAPDGQKRPASLPAGEDTRPTSLGRKPRVKVSGVKS